MRLGLGTRYYDVYWLMLHECNHYRFHNGAFQYKWCSTTWQTSIDSDVVIALIGGPENVIG